MIVGVNRIGESKTNISGSKMSITKYTSAMDLDVQFENGYVVKNIQYTQFKKGNIKNVYDPSVYGIGFLGDGIFKATTNDRVNLDYKTWRDMIKRCYNETNHKKHPSYKECTVHESWHNFQTFASWFHENYYEIKNEKMQLDKDILIKNNKVYSPLTCVIVPAHVNKFFMVKKNNRGLHPIGVCYMDKIRKYMAQCNNGGTGRRYIGVYDTPEEAFESFKTSKEKYAKELANNYKGIIPQKVYDILMNYTVNIND